jgi:hypothetical protein
MLSASVFSPLPLRFVARLVLVATLQPAPTGRAMAKEDRMRKRRGQAMKDSRCVPLLPGTDC